MFRWFRRKSWQDRINQARKRGHFTEEDATLAGRWHSCAVGELIFRGKSQRDEHRATRLARALPYNVESAGVQFSYNVRRNDFDAVQQCYDVIRDYAENGTMVSTFR